MLDRLSPRALAISLCSAVLTAVAAAYIAVAGSAVVVDETGGVVAAVVVTGDGREQPLHRRWAGYFYAIPRLEGEIEVRCRDGTRKSWGYVTGYMDTQVRVVGNSPCERLVEA